MDGGGIATSYVTLFVNRFTQNVKDASEGGFADGNPDGCTGVHDFHATNQPVGGTHGDGANLVITEELLDFAGDGDVFSRLVFSGNFEGVIDAGHLTRGEFGIDDGTDDLGNVARIGFFCRADHACLYLM